MKKYAIVSTDFFNNRLLNESTSSSFTQFPVNNNSTKMIVPFSDTNANVLKQFKHYSHSEIIKELEKPEWQNHDSVLSSNYDSTKRAAFLSKAAEVEGKLDQDKGDSVDLIQKTPNKDVPVVAVQKPDGLSFLATTSHDFTDKTTWFQKSTRVTAEPLSGTGVGPYTSDNEYWIDLSNGKHPREDDIASPYLPVIYDNGSPVTSGITINYALGTVVFSAAPTGPVTADYSYAGSSEWCVKPAAGMVLSIEHAELDYTTDVSMGITYFEIWAYNPMDPPNKMMVQRHTYKTMKDIIKIANTTEIIPGVADITNNVLRAVFDYGASIDLKDTLGMELRIKIADDTPFSGEFGSVTLYTTEEKE